MGHMMGVTIVGQSNGRRQVRWKAALLLACALGIFSGAVAGGIYFALCGEFSFLATLLGFSGPFITVGSGIQRSLKLPVDQLTPLNGSAA